MTSLRLGARVRPDRNWRLVGVLSTDVGYVLGFTANPEVVRVFWPRIGREGDFHINFLKLAPSGLDVILELIDP